MKSGRGEQLADSLVMHAYQNSDAVEIQPTFTTLDSFPIVGVERFTEKGMDSLMEAWSEFSRRYSEIPHKAVPPIVWAYEDYSRGFEPVEGGFPRYYFIVGVHVTGLEDVPDGLVGKVAAAGKYAQFEYEGILDRLNEVFRYIYDEWLPSSDYKLDPERQADLVRYPERMDDDFGKVQIYVPVVSKN